MNTPTGHAHLGSVRVTVLEEGVTEVSSHGLQVCRVEVVSTLLPEQGATEGGLHGVAVTHPQLPPHVHTSSAKLQGTPKGPSLGETQI